MNVTGTPSIIQVISHLDIGGAEEVAISLAEQLHREYAFTFFAVLGIASTPIGQRMQARLQAINVPVVSGTALDMKRGGALQAGLRLGQLIRQRRPDLVHLHTEIPETTGALATLAGMPAGTQLVRTVHNSTIWPAWQRIGAWTERRLRRAQVVGVSEASLDGLRAFQAARGLPVTPAHQARVVYNGVRGSQAAPHPLRPADQPLRIIFAGRFEPAKGVDLLPEVLRLASAQTTRPVEMTIVGSGSLEPQLRAWVERHSLPWTVRLDGPLPNLGEQLRDYDLMLMPSRFEGLALVAIESMLAGAPVVAARVPGLTEVFPPDYPLFARAEDPADLARVLVQAIEHFGEYRQLVETTQAEIGRKFSLSGMAAGYRAFYDQTLRPAPAVLVAP